MNQIRTILILSAFLLATLQTDAQSLIADFTADRQEACNELVVNFTDLSTANGNISYFWDFGNGQTSNLQNPTTVYTLPGFYSVTLQISDGINSASVTKEDYIKIFNGPSADFNSQENTIGCAPFAISFADNSNAGDAPIVFWQYDFGDGNFSNNPNTQHSYNYQNHFSPVLTVIDTNGCSNFIQKQDLVEVYKPAAEFSATTVPECEGIVHTQFLDHSFGTQDLTYSWSFGDGASSALQNPEHSYTQTDSFDVSLNITDSIGCTDFLTKEDFIKVYRTTANFSVEQDTICPGDEIIFINTSLLANEYIWDFGDGQSSQTSNPTHQFTESGNYPVRLIANSADGCSDTAIYNIHVQEIIADFSQTNSFVCSLPAEIAYENTSQNADTFYWNFNDLYFSKEENPSITYTEQGYFFTELIVKSKYGCADTLYVENALEITMPRAYFTPNNWENPQEIGGCAPVDVHLNYAGYYNTEKDSIISYRWDFGDGNTSVQQNPSHIYPEVGQYTIALKLTTARGCNTSYYAMAQAGNPQSPDFNKLNSDTVCASEEVEFLDLSTDQELINKWRWEFGDEQSSSYQNPTHFFADTGYMDVKLSVFHNGCETDTLKENFIYIKGPLAHATAETNCTNPHTVAFIGKTTDAENYYWDFGDGSAPVHNIPDLTHKYPETKDYTYKLVLENSSTQCNYEILGKLNIRRAQAVFSVPDEPTCANTPISFSGTNSADAEYFIYEDVPGLYLWDFGDGSQKIITDKPVQHSYSQGGTYNVSLEVQDINGCTHKLTKAVRIFKARANFSISEQTGCMPLNVQFDNLSYSDTLVADYLWDFGDGQTSDEKNPLHSFSQYGFYDVSLKITDTMGCSSVITKDDFIRSYEPNANFSATGKALCLGEETQFQSVPNEDIIAWQWDFGDGQTSDEKNPAHSYPDSGRYDVQLAVTDIRGCNSENLKLSFVEIQQYPSAAFSAEQSNFACYPAEVNFYSEADLNTASQWLWDFGDGQTSELPNPLHIYTMPEQYDVVLSVSSSFGCESNHGTDEFIRVDGPYADIISPDTVCKSEPVLFSFENAKGIYDSEWVFDDGSSHNSDSAYFAFHTFGNHISYLHLRADDAGTCDKVIADTLNVRLFEANISLENGFEACMPYRAEFYSPNPALVNSLWSFGTGDYSELAEPEYIYSEAGSYYPEVIITDTHGCTDTAQTEIIVLELPDVYASADTVICEGTSATLRAGGAISYEWFPDIELQSAAGSEIVAQPTVSRMYFVAGTDSNGCTAQQPIYITVNPKPEYFLNDTSIIIGETVDIGFASEAFSEYYWYADYLLEHSDSGIISVSPMESSEFEWTAKDTSGCFEFSEEIWVEVQKKYTLDMPDAFTPNSDGINDVLYVKGFGIKELISFEVYNRYGERVFYTNDLNEGWRGNLSKHSQNIETYRYLVKTKMYNNEILIKSGSVKLLK